MRLILYLDDSYALHARGLGSMSGTSSVGTKSEGLRKGVIDGISSIKNITRMQNVDHFGTVIGPGSK